MVLHRVNVRGDDPVSLDPEPVDVILETQPRREEGREPLAVVVGGDTAVHAPVLVCHRWPEVHEHVHVVELFETLSQIVPQEEVDEIDGVDVVCPCPKRLRDLHHGVGRHVPFGQDKRVL